MYLDNIQKTMKKRLGKLPSVIKENTFNEDGLVETEDGLLVPVYVASQLGFNEPGQYYLNEYFYPELKKLNILPLCPFKACGEYLDMTELNDEMTVGELNAFWGEFNSNICPINYGTLMPHAKFIIAILDGGHTIDDGVATEIGHYSAGYNRPIIGIRTDIRLAENIMAPINPAATCIIKSQGGTLFNGPGAYKDALDYIGKTAEKIINNTR